jgi:hypothetical protein
MIDYKNEYEDLKTIYHKTSIYRNTIYKLSHDENIKLFKKDILENIKNYSDLERMKKHYFKNDFDKYFEIVNILFNTIIKDKDFKNYAGEDFYKCCNVFPDYMGEQFIEIISYIPIMKVMKNIFLKEEYSGKLETLKKYQIEKPSWLANIKKDTLESFVDEEGQIQFLEEELIKLEKEIDKNLIPILLEQMIDLEEIKKVGILYYNSVKEKKELEINNLRNALISMSEVFSKITEENKD